MANSTVYFNNQNGAQFVGSLSVAYLTCRVASNQDLATSARTRSRTLPPSRCIPVRLVLMPEIPLQRSTTCVSHPHRAASATTWARLAGREPVAGWRAMPEPSLHQPEGLVSCSGQSVHCHNRWLGSAELPVVFQQRHLKRTGRMRA